MRKGYLIFENVPFKQLAKELEKKYGVTFLIQFNPLMKMIYIALNLPRMKPLKMLWRSYIN